MRSKQHLRKWVKEERKKLDLKLISQKLVDKLQYTDEYKQAKNILIYYPLKDEIDLLKLLEDKTKKFYLPRIEGNELLCCPYSCGDQLCKSSFKTKEPLTEPVNKKIIDLVVVPALAVDKNNYRLGYGGGFYDRFLADVSVLKVTCIPEKFLLESVFPENHDICIDKVIIS